MRIIRKGKGKRGGHLLPYTGANTKKDPNPIGSGRRRDTCRGIKKSDEEKRKKSTTTTPRERKEGGSVSLEGSTHTFD